ncbi:proline dehydrogenase family protein, partial [Marinobacter adhaerens]|uniref:proline dehydrogenase family protein n=2 Tax=Pseudomonadota TaxID=1224 RepID=UPI001C5EBE28
SADAARYDRAYGDAIAAIARACNKGSVEQNPGISIKLSALHPRYEVAQEARVMRELVPVVLRLAQAAKAANMGMNIDAEEQDRLV